MTKPKGSDKLNLEALVRLGLIRDGLAVPETETEVELLEQSCDLAKVDVPLQLRDPRAVLARRHTRRQSAGSVPAKPLDASDDARESLGRAAREGASIPSDVEERMVADRKKAEEGDSEDG